MPLFPVLTFSFVHLASSTYFKMSSEKPFQTLPHRLPAGERWEMAGHSSFVFWAVLQVAVSMTVYRPCFFLSS